MINKKQKREKRKLHIRKKMSGTSIKPRIFVFKSNRYFYVGVADDSVSKVLMGKGCHRKKEDILKMAKEFAKDIKKKKIKTAVFDRSGYKYHGLIKIFADQLRSEGINI
jgi:large subunit ribosomal protein L18